MRDISEIKLVADLFNTDVKQFCNAINAKHFHKNYKTNKSKIKVQNNRQYYNKLIKQVESEDIQEYFERCQEETENKNEKIELRLNSIDDDTMQDNLLNQE